MALDCVKNKLTLNKVMCHVIMILLTLPAASQSCHTDPQLTNLFYEYNCLVLHISSCVYIRNLICNNFVIKKLKYKHVSVKIYNV